MVVWTEATARAAGGEGIVRQEESRQSSFQKECRFFCSREEAHPKAFAFSCRKSSASSGIRGGGKASLAHHDGLGTDHTLSCLGRRPDKRRRKEVSHEDEWEVYEDTREEDG